MSQQPFDKAIRQSLENIEIAFNADHWQQMEMLLHNLPVGDEGAIDAHFDAIIKDKISHPSTPSNLSSAWVGIEAGLVKAEAVDAEFDATIIDKIKQPIALPASNWEHIANALDSAEAADVAFDKEIYTSLHNLQASPPPNYWQRLVNKLNADFALREKLYRYKLIEATLMILLLLNFYQYLPSNHAFVPSSAMEQANQSIIPSGQKILEKAVGSPVNIASKVNTTNRTKAKSTAKQPSIAKTATTKNDNSIENSSLTILAETNTTVNIYRNYSLTPPITKLPAAIEKRSSLAISVGEMNQHLTLHTETGNFIIQTVPS